MTIVTRQPIPLTLRVTDADWVNQFDVLEVWRSRDGAAGPFEELTAAIWSPASFSVLGKPYVISGKTLSFLLDEKKKLDITFTSSDPLSSSTISSQIQTQTNGVLISSVTSEPTLLIETAEAGSNTVLRVLESEGAGALGLSSQEPASVSFGKNPRIKLVRGIHLYTYIDADGDWGFYYQTRFRNSQTGAVSAFSTAFLPVREEVEPAQLVLGSIDLIDASGVAMSNVRILIYNAFVGTLVDGMLVMGGPIEKLTDSKGHAEFMLVRGTKVSLSIMGTALARDITVPTDPAVDAFNLLDPSVGTQDLFNVQVPNYPYATRRSL